MSVQQKPTEIEDTLTLHRAERFLDIGFDEDSSFALAESKGKDGFPLYWGDIKKVLDQGATHDQAVAIFADEAH